MQVLITDDNPVARKILSLMIEQVTELKLVGECEDALQTFNFLQKNAVDLLFLDVEMPGMSGLELLHTLKFQPIVVLFTSKKEYAADAFDLNVADYLVKPVTKPRFLAAVARARVLFDGKNNKIDAISDEKEKDFLFVRTNGALMKLEHNKILFVQALVDYVQFMMDSGKKITVHNTLKNVESHLPPTIFARSHRSYIVNLSKIEKIEEGVMAVIDKNRVPISDQYKIPILKKLNLL
jgi:two-component system, LytTR family, response regulator